MLDTPCDHADDSERISAYKMQDMAIEDVWELFNPRSGANGGHHHGQQGSAIAAADARTSSDAQIEDDYRQHVVSILQTL